MQVVWFLGQRWLRIGRRGHGRFEGLMTAATEEGPVAGSLLTVAEVAGVLRVSNMTVYRLIKAGELPAIRVGKSFRIHQRELTAFLSEGVVRVEKSNG
jgi:excisionase family DNA binding protein